VPASLLAALAVACSSGGDGEPAATGSPAATASPAPAAATASPTPEPTAQSSEAMSVAAADGTATLMIPEGALPPGVDASDIQIVPIPLDDFETSENVVVLAAYKLTPDGLQLARPAVLRLSLGDGAESGLIFILHLSEDSVEFLQIRLPADGTAILTEVEVEVSHFSDLVGARIREDLEEEAAKAFPGTIAVEGGNTHVVGSPFDITGAVAKKPVDVTVEIGGPGTPTLQIRFRGEFEPKKLSFTTKNREKVQPISGPSSRDTVVSRGDDITTVNGGTANPFVWPFVCEEVSQFNGIEFDAVGTVKVDWERYGTEGTLFRSGTDEIEVRVVKYSSVSCVASAPPPEVTAVAPPPPAGTAITTPPEPPPEPPADESGTGSTSSYVEEGNGVTMTVSAPDEVTPGQTYEVQVSITGPDGKAAKGKVSCTLARKGDPDAVHLENVTLSSDGTATLPLKLKDSWKRGDEVALFCFFPDLDGEARFITSFFIQ
jgi:hypothetical protein